jgi:formylglycine-generating enzyme required for sulfatase activity
MSVKSVISVAALAAGLGTGVGGLAVSSALAQVTVPTVPIGNPGNAPDPAFGGLGWGEVGYSYNIGTTEVTNAQYAAFLNAVAGTDTYNLFNPNMAITRTGTAGSYTYQPLDNRGNHPVNYVSFWDAARFANWLHNGQGNADTETGAYSLNGVLNPANGSVTRNAGWNWAVASQNEWYKAAYFQPSSLGGDVDNYWQYPISSNFAPQPSQANILGTGFNDTTPVGFFAPNFAGTYDMAGNVREWNDTIIQGGRTIRGGGFFNFPAGTGAGLLDFSQDPTLETFDLGFRVVQIPGPASLALLAIGGLVTARRRR